MASLGYLSTILWKRLASVAHASAIGAGGEPRRNQALSASSRWVRGMVALARHVTGHGHLRPLVTTAGAATDRASTKWQPLDTPELRAALTSYTAVCPPAARAAVVRGNPPPPADPDEFAAAFHRWLVDLTASVTLRSFRWTADLVGQRSAEATALREPPVAGGGVPVLGHGWKLARDPLSFMSRLRDHGDVVRLKLGPKTVYAVTTPALTGAVALSPEPGALHLFGADGRRL